MPLLTVDHTAHPQQLWLGRDDHAHALAGDVPALPSSSCSGIATGHGMLVAWSRREAYVYASERVHASPPPALTYRASGVLIEDATSSRPSATPSVTLPTGAAS